MPMKGDGSADEWREIDRFDGGVGWIAYPEETMQRASHAVVGDDGGVWVIDPVDVDGLDDLLGEFGEVAGVVVLLDRHKRDSAAVANRHDVSVWVPSFMDGVASELDAPIERFDGELGSSGFVLHELVDNSFWQEGVLYNEEGGVRVVPEAVGGSGYFRTSERALGVHPMLRLLPPRELSRFRPSRVLVGHGPGVSEDAPEALSDAISGARVRTPRLFFKNVKDLVIG